MRYGYDPDLGYDDGDPKSPDFTDRLTDAAEAAE